MCGADLRSELHRKGIRLCRIVVACRLLSICVYPVSSISSCPKPRCAIPALPSLVYLSSSLPSSQRLFLLLAPAPALTANLVSALRLTLNITLRAVLVPPERAKRARTFDEPDLLGRARRQHSAPEEGARDIARDAAQRDAPAVGRGRGAQVRTTRSASGNQGRSYGARLTFARDLARATSGSGLRSGSGCGAYERLTSQTRLRKPIWRRVGEHLGLSWME